MIAAAQKTGKWGYSWKYRARLGLKMSWDVGWLPLVLMGRSWLILTLLTDTNTDNENWISYSYGFGYLIHCLIKKRYLFGFTFHFGPKKLNLILRGFYDFKMIVRSSAVSIACVRRLMGRLKTRKKISYFRTNVSSFDMA